MYHRIRNIRIPLFTNGKNFVPDLVPCIECFIVPRFIAVWERIFVVGSIARDITDRKQIIIAVFNDRSMFSNDYYHVTVLCQSEEYSTED